MEMAIKSLDFMGLLKDFLHLIGLFLPSMVSTIFHQDGSV
jgi:hypothetical protein